MTSNILSIVLLSECDISWTLPTLADVRSEETAVSIY